MGDLYDLETKKLKQGGWHVECNNFEKAVLQLTWIIYNHAKKYFNSNKNYTNVTKKDTENAGFEKKKIFLQNVKDLKEQANFDQIW